MKFLITIGLIYASYRVLFAPSNNLVNDKTETREELDKEGFTPYEEIE